LDSGTITCSQNLQITELDVSYSTITAEQLSRLLAASSGQMKLNLRGCELGEGMITCFQNLQITELDVSESTITAEQLSRLLAASSGQIKLKLSGCRELDFGRISFPKDLIITELVLAQPQCMAMLTPLQFGNLLERVQDITSVVPPLQSTRDQDLALDHIHNRDSRTFLQFVNELEQQHNDIKLRLVCCILEKIESTLSHSVIPALRDILYSDRLYTTNHAIQGFITRKIWPAAIQSCERKYTVFSEVELQALLPELTSLCQKVSPGGVDFNGTHLSLAHFSSLVNHCLYQTAPTNSKDPNSPEHTELKNAYANISFLKSIMKRIEFTEDELQFLFVGEKNGHIHGVGVTREYLHEAVVACNPSTPWNNCYIYLNETHQSQDTPLGPVFSIVTLFENNFLHSQNNAKLVSLMPLLNLPSDLNNQFIEATKNKSSDNKWGDQDTQQTLLSILEPLVDEGFSDAEGRAQSMQLIPSFVAKVMANYEIETCSAQTQALYFLALSALFVKSTSSRFLGADNDSPLAVRYLALGFLNHAMILNPMLIQHDTIENWRNTLVGINGAFTCTGVLSTAMYDAIKGITGAPGEPDAQTILGTVMPSAWL
jgi:SopA-like catalytic domain